MFSVSFLLYRICRNKRPPQNRRLHEPHFAIFQWLLDFVCYWINQSIDKRSCKTVIFQRGEYTKPTGFRWVSFQRGEYTKPMALGILFIASKNWAPGAFISAGMVTWWIFLQLFPHQRRRRADAVRNNVCSSNDIFQLHVHTLLCNYSIKLLYCPAVFGHFLDPPGNHPCGAIFPKED